MKIYTLTLNPAFDIHAQAAALSVGRENFATITNRDAGGKGVNISRALLAAGIQNTAIVVLGGENGMDYKNLLLQYGVDAVYLEKDGRIRENLTMHHGDEETRISFSGFRVNEDLFCDVTELISADDETIVTFTGSIPDGISKEAAKSFLLGLKNRGVKIVLDCRSFDLEDIEAVKPWLVKPNQQEVSEWFGLIVSTQEQALACAEKLYFLGVENALVSMGRDGAALAFGEVLYAVPPKVQTVSTIGAGDSSLAGFISAFVQGRTRAECLRQAVAFGTAACMTEGTHPPRMADVEMILQMS